MMPRDDRRALLWFVVIALASQLPMLFWGVPGAKAINNAIRILDGDVPYRDFWTMYAPGHFYLVAALFKLFGSHVFVQGVACQLLIALHGASLFAIVRRLGLSRALSLAAGASLVLAQWGSRELSAYEPVLLCSLLAVLHVLRYVQGEGPGRLIVAGALVGVGAWFKHDVAAYFAIGTAAALVGAWFARSDRLTLNWVSPVQVPMRIGGTAALCVAPVVLWLVAIGAAADAWRALIVFPATDFSVVRGEGYPSPIPDFRLMAAWLRHPTDVALAQGVGVNISQWIQATVPYLTYGAGLITLIRLRRQLDAGALAVTMMCLALMPFFWASAHVQHNTNFTSLWICSVVLGALAWTRVVRTRAHRRMAIALFVAGLIGWVGPVTRDLALIAYEWQGHGTLSFPGVTGVRAPKRALAFHEPINTFIRSRVPPGERIYSGLTRHDSIVVSNQSFYYLSDRRPGTRHNEIHPGIADREETQREIIADLERWGVRCVVLWDFGWTKEYMDAILAERRKAIPELGATILDAYIRNEFEEIGRYGEYVLMWRKGSDKRSRGREETQGREAVTAGASDGDRGPGGTKSPGM